MADIFISYARADRDRVENLAQALEAAGWSVWWDRHIQSGAEFSKDIENELDIAKAVIVAWSQEANASRWVKDESNEAAEAGKLLAISLDGEQPPLGFRQYHTVNFADWSGKADAPAVQELKRAIAARLSGEAADPAPAAAMATPAQSPRGGIPQAVWIVGIVAAAIVAIVAIALNLGGGSKTDGGDRAAAVETDVDRSKSIAVLPFDDFSADDNEWFADGLTEEILNSLARTPDLLVASRTSSFKYKEADEEIPVIAARLGVENVLEGSVRRAGDRLRVTAQLIRASDGFHLWSENYDRNADDVIAIQEEIAIEIAKALKTAMDPEALADMVSAGTHSVEAYEAYLEGLALRAEYSASGEGSLQRAEAAFERARAADPGFAAAHFESAFVWRQNLTPTVIGARDVSAVDENYRQYRKRIEAAITAARDRPERLRYQADLSQVDFRLRDAITELTAYLDAKPLDAAAWGELAIMSVRAGDFAAALEATSQGEKIAGEDIEAQASIIINYVWGKDYEAGARAARRAIRLDDAHWSNMYQAHRALLWAGAIEEAAAILPAVTRVDFAPSNAMLAAMRQSCAEGDRAAAEEIFNNIRTLTEDERSGAEWIALHLLGRADEAAAMIAPYDRASPPILLQAWLYYPYFDASRHLHFQRLMERERINRPPPVKIPFACPPAAP